jgi:multidrug efflux pump subunit AcrA (membrane-fusion protein)
VVVVGAAVAYWQRQALAPGRKSPSAARSFRTVKAFNGNLERSLRVAGVTAAERFSMLMAPQMLGTRSHGAAGYQFMLVLQKLAPAGSFVKKGDVVAEFDRLQMLLRLDDYKAMADQHERNLAKLKAWLAVTRAGYDQRVLVAKGVMEKAAQDVRKAPVLSAINQEKFRLNYEEAKAAYEELRDDEQNVITSETAAIARSESDLRVSRLEYERAQRNADRMLVKAPLDGMVVMMTTFRGGSTGQIQEGDQVGSGQPYMRIVDLSKMVVTAAVNQVDAQAVRLGMRARVHFDAYPEVELPARVSAVGAFAQTGGWRANYVRGVPIQLKLDRTDPMVIPDLSVSADLVLESAENATIVPREAVFGDDEPYAFVHESDGGWEKRSLEVVLTNATAVAVRSGVNPGDVLAAEPPAQVGQ